MQPKLTPEVTALFAAFGALLWRLEQKGVLTADELSAMWRDATLCLPSQGEDKTEVAALDLLHRLTGSQEFRGRKA